MKRFLSAILVIGILLSMAIIPAGAEVTREFKLIAEYDGTAVPINGWKHWTVNTNEEFPANSVFSTWASPAANITMTSEDKFEEGNPGTLVRPQEGMDCSLSLYMFISDYNTAPKSDKGLEIRNGHTALTFKAALSENAQLKVNVNGFPTTTDFSAGVPASGGYTSFMLETGKTGANSSSYNHTKDVKDYKGSTSFANTIKRNTLQEYKFIFDYDNGTYDLYIDNKPVAKGRALGGTKYLQRYYVSISAFGTANNDAYGFIDDVHYYTLTADDLTAQYTAEESEGGKIVLNDAITAAGKEASFTITPNEGGAVKSVTIGGEVIEGIAPEGGTYTFTAESGENNVISAEYNTYIYNAEQTVGGKIVINDEITAVNQQVSYTVTPDSGYIVKNVTVGGEAQEGIASEGGTYTFTAKATDNPVITAEFEKLPDPRAFKKIAEYDGTSVPINGWKHWTVKTNEEFPANSVFSTWASGAANILMTSEDKFEEGNPGTLVRPQEGKDATLSLYMFYAEYNSAPKSDKGLEIRNGHTALTFKAALSDNALLKVNVNGFASTTDFSAGVPAKGGIANYMLESGKTGAGITSYNYVKDSNYEGYTTYADVIKRNTLQEYKFIFDYDNGTYDLYVDNKQVINDKTLGGVKYLDKYTISISTYGTANNDAYGFIDDARYYTLAAEDLNAQYTAEESEGGKIVINDIITAAGKEASFTITPNEGYTVKSVTAGGEVIEGIAPEGGTYTFTAKAGLDNVISAEYDTYRVFKKEFALDFEANNEGSWIGGSGAAKSFAKCPANDVSYGNYYSYANASGEIISENGNKMLKINLPAKAEGATAIASNRINFLWTKNDTFGKFTTEPFAISFKLGLEDGVTAALEVDDGGAEKIGSSIFFNAGAGVISNYDYEQTTVMNYTDIDTYRDLSGIHEYKVVVNPADATYDMYIDGDLVAENVHLRSASMLYYFRLVVKNDKGEEDKTAYLDDFSLWLLTDEHTDIQPDVNQTGNGRAVTSEAVVKKGEEVTYEFIPDEGSYIKNVYINGAPIAAFCADSVSVVISDTTKRNVVDVEFADYEEGKPSVYRTPFAAKEGNAMYLFFKLGANGVTADSFGIVVSKTNKNPDSENGTLVPSEGALTTKGYFGYKLTADEGCYIRPYVKSGETIFYGEAEWMHPYKISNFLGE